MPLIRPGHHLYPGEGFESNLNLFHTGLIGGMGIGNPSGFLRMKGF